MTLYRLLVLNAQSAKTVSWIELLVKHHACLLIVVVFQSQILWESLLLHLLVYQVLPLDHMVVIGSDHHIGLYITVF